MRLPLFCLTASLLLQSALASGQTASNVVCSACINTGDVQNGAITSTKIANAGIASVDLANDSVTSSKIKDGSVAWHDLQSGVRKFLTQGGMPVFSAGSRIGYLFDANSYDGLTELATLISNSGYLFSFNPNNGVVPLTTVYFSGPNCTGEIYFDFYDQATATSGRWRRWQGLVFRVADDAMYVPRGSALVTRDYLSKFDRDAGVFGECIAEMGVTGGAGIALLNDPAVTGVPGPTIDTPVAFGIP